MILREKQQRQLALYYLLCFLLNYAWNFFHGLTFSSLRPVFFVNRFDLTLNLLMISDLQHLLIKHRSLQIIFDLLNLFFPVCLVWAYIKKSRAINILAVSASFFALVYYLFFAAMSFYSAEVFISWIFIPLIFYTSSSKGFYYRMQIVRIIFITVFFSSALWKIRTGAIFNIEQMSAILLRQHSSILAEHNSGLSLIITYLIKHQSLSFLLYLTGFFSEFIFITAFFTRKYDRVLIIFFVLFLLFDYALMGINYFPWLPFAGCLYFSKYKFENDKGS